MFASQALITPIYELWVKQKGKHILTCIEGLVISELPSFSDDLNIEVRYFLMKALCLDMTCQLKLVGHKDV